MCNIAMMWDQFTTTVKLCIGSTILNREKNTNQVISYEQHLGTVGRRNSF